MRKKERLLRALRAVGILRLARLIHASAHRLTILAYHRVVDLGDEASFPYDPELVSASPAEFEWQMSFVARHYDVVRLADVIAHVDGGTRLPRRPLVVTFDDGFDDNYHHAYPVLKTRQLPATFFVSTGYIGTTSTFWFDRVARLLTRVPPRSIRLPEVPEALPISDAMVSRRQGAALLLTALKSMRDVRRRAIMAEFDRLDEQIVVPAHAARPATSQPMSWAQIKEMSRGGMEFGSHTVSHPVLAQVTDEELREELVKSKRVLEDHLQQIVPVISYPVGTEEAFDTRVVGAVRAAGYRLACSYVAGSNNLRAVNPYALRRQHVERYSSRLYFEGLTGLPNVID